MTLIEKFSISKPDNINSYFGLNYYVLNKFQKENLLPIETYQIRDKNTKIVVSEFLCKVFSAQYLETRKNNICRNLGLNPDFFEWY